ncbi:hypothetical protein BD779DRAFT_1609113 [Infundibulicybe gibba]|nr:hypothetical protein BD779DRAFT_1609113 [Infundibulicybe gibba]
MVRGLLWVALGPSLVNPIHAHPVNSTPDRLFYTSKTEKSWLWGWAWGAESRVSVLDHAPILSFPSRPAAFGAEIVDPILGYIIPLSSFTVPCVRESTTYPPPNPGCPDLCLSGPSRPSETWIALVQRGQCEFVKKVREAQRLGARAVVVGGDDPLTSGYPDTLVNMYSPEDASDVRIAATYIKYSDYIQLSSLIATSNTSHSGLKTLSLLITAEYSAWEWYSPIITFIIILLLPSALTFITLLIHRLRAARAAQRDRAPEDVVRNLPWHVWDGKRWEKHEGENTNSSPASSDNDLVESDTISRAPTSEVLDDDALNEASTSAKAPGEQPWFEQQVECAICLSEFEKGDKVRVLPCHHIFHLEEVDEWLIQRKKLCPVCKADVTQTPATTPNEPHLPNPETPTERTPLLSDDTSRHL